MSTALFQTELPLSRLAQDLDLELEIRANFFANIFHFFFASGFGSAKIHVFVGPDRQEMVMEVRHFKSDDSSSDALTLSRHDNGLTDLFSVEKDARIIRLWAIEMMVDLNFGYNQGMA